MKALSKRGENHQSATWSDRQTETVGVRGFFCLFFPNEHSCQLSLCPIQLAWKLQAVLLLHRILQALRDGGNSVFSALIPAGRDEGILGKTASKCEGCQGSNAGSQSAFSLSQGVSYVRGVFGSGFLAPREGRGNMKG